ncbi:MAG: hypothetical protein GX254_00950 [Clostridiales bacterium]|nr:hypothetical protein [Clostridiales bacterium]
MSRNSIALQTGIKYEGVKKMIEKSSYRTPECGKGFLFPSIKPAKKVFIKQSLFYGGALITIYLLTGLALRILGVA